VEGSIPLSCLRDGESALIDRIIGPDDHVHRLQEFGLLGGAMIEVFRGGSPCIIRLEGGKVCLRADDLLRVLVKRPGGPTPELKKTA